MSLTAGMWTGVSGLLQHGDKMNVIGNNIANVNTIGFKGQRMDFEDFIYQNIFTAQGPSQLGRGVTAGALMGDFNQGAFESTTDPTDLAIGGAGFFKVKPQGTDIEYFTRAGNFRFDKDGFLNDPHGYALQGWAIDNTEAPTRGTGGTAAAVVGASTSQFLGTGTPVDVRLDTFTIDPKQTTNVQFQAQLDQGVDDRAVNANNPFAALFNTWDGTQPPANTNTPPIPQDAYAYQTSLTVFDESGAKQEITVYFDRVDTSSIEGVNSNEQHWEYIVTMDPSQDERMVAFGGTPAGPGGVPPAVPSTVVPMKETKNAGLLMSGTMAFTGAGQLINQSAYTIMGSKMPTEVPPDSGNRVTDDNFFIDNDGNSIPIMGANLAALQGDGDTSDVWFPAEISGTGLPLFVANFTGVPGAQTAGSENGDSYFIEFDLGLEVSNFENPWVNPDASLGSLEVLGRPLANFEGAAVTPIPAGPVPPATGLPTAITNGITPAVINAPPFIFTNPAFDALAGVIPPLPTNGTPLAPPAVLGYTAADINRFEFLPDEQYLDNVGGVLQLNADGIALAARTFGYAATAVGVAPAFPAIPGIALPQTDLLGIMPDATELSNMTPPPIRDSNATTSFDGSSSTRGGSQNGYGFGELSSYSVDREGVLSGVYSNGVTLPLYQIALYDFVAKQGLFREGGNLFSETRDSGSPSQGVANTNGLGTVQAQVIEQSNVDLSREFVLMITTQRGFEANSKIITTVDTMLDTVINMKR